MQCRLCITPSKVAVVPFGACKPLMLRLCASVGETQTPRTVIGSAGASAWKYKQLGRAFLQFLPRAVGVF